MPVNMGAADPQTPPHPGTSKRYTLLRDIKPNLKSNEIVKDLIPRRAFGEFHADSGGGKTAIIVDLLLHVADGREYRNRRVERQPVVYVALEGHAGIENRIYAARQWLGITDAPFALVKASDNFRDPKAAEDVARDANELVQAFGRGDGTDNPIIAIDTYQAALGAGGSDCDPAAVSEFIANVQQHLLTNCTVIVLHHFGKDQSRGGRGWSGLRAALDFELEIDHDGDGLRTMRVTKSRDGSDQQPAFCYQLCGLELGVNEYGEPVTAVVVEHLADEADVKSGKRLTPKARAALNVLWEIIKGNKGQSWPMADRQGLKCTMMRVWEKECIAFGVISKAAGEAERRYKFKHAKDELLAANAIVTDSDGGQRVYPAPKASVTGGDAR